MSVRVSGSSSIARPSASLSSSSARVLQRTALRYSAGAEPGSDRPAHVRAGSGVCIVDVPGVGHRLAVVQDDANFIALIEPTKHGRVDFIELPAGPGGLRQFDKDRGNKMSKLDLESIVAIDVDGSPGLLCMGSGSSLVREVCVVVRFGADGTAVARALSAPALFKQLRERHDFAGDELTIEGAVVVGDMLRLFNRGNGSGDAVDAVVDVSLSQLLKHLDDPLLHAAPKPGGVRAVGLGRVNGTRLTLTDATRHPDGRTLFLAAAEASPNAIDDGDVTGTAIGVLHEDGNTTLVPLLDERGLPLLDKVEGIAVDPARPDRAFVVVDKDDPDAPADLLVVQLPS